MPDADEQGREDDLVYQPGDLIPTLGPHGASQALEGLERGAGPAALDAQRRIASVARRTSPASRRLVFTNTLSRMIRRPGAIQ